MRFLTFATLMLLAVPAAPAFAQTGGNLVAKDLGTVIALQGKPCGGVKSYERRGENDYTATCASGDRYRVHVSAEGRVLVDKL